MKPSPIKKSNKIRNIYINGEIPPIYFYIPVEATVDTSWPQTIDEYWEWLKVQGIQCPGEQSWVLQTYLYLKDADFPCQFTNSLPEEGLVVAHKVSLKAKRCLPNSRTFLVCARADKNPYDCAQLHVVQNKKQAAEKGLSTAWKSFYIPHWPQSGLIPRDLDRGDRFENIVYLGDRVNLAPELKTESWKAQIANLGLNWIVVDDAKSWNDYSHVDAVLAVRSFDSNRYDHKPASKLFNAWRAGVPAILGCESAFQTERQSELDYLEAPSVDALIAAIVKLRDDTNFRQSVILNGKKRAEEIKPSAVRNSWIDFLVNQAVPAYYRWCSTPEPLQKAYVTSKRALYWAWRAQKYLSDAMQP
ncbi:MAG: hypothetical protein WA885_06250 [Phormidesmis sp.]